MPHHAKEDPRCVFHAKDVQPPVLTAAAATGQLVLTAATGQFFLSSIVLLLCKLYRRVQSMLTAIQRQPAIAHRECAMHGAIIFPQSARLPCKPPGFVCGAARNIAGPSGPFRIESTTQSCRRTSVPTGSIPKQDLWRLGLQITT